MRLLDVTLPSPQLNLACDEALLEACEEGGEHDLLRFWEPREHFVVLGYSSRIRSDVKLAACRQANVPVLRRCSGGGTVLQGPGCLNFTLVLRTADQGPTAGIRQTTAYVLERHQRALGSLLDRPVEVQGYSDLTVGGLKFSGNSQRRRQRAILFHGTVLLSLDLDLVERLLAMPELQPPYRRGRAHQAFLTNLEVGAADVKRALAECWGAKGAAQVPVQRAEELARVTYGSEAWTTRW
jgi:lipoate-protein ligase A